MARYYLGIDGATKGPFELDEIRSLIDLGSFRRQDYICKEGEQEWKSADSYPDLFNVPAQTKTPENINKSTSQNSATNSKSIQSNLQNSAGANAPPKKSPPKGQQVYKPSMPDSKPVNQSVNQPIDKSKREANTQQESTSSQKPTNDASLKDQSVQEQPKSKTPQGQQHYVPSSIPDDVAEKLKRIEEKNRKASKSEHKGDLKSKPVEKEQSTKKPDLASSFERKIIEIDVDQSINEPISIPRSSEIIELQMDQSIDIPIPVSDTDKREVFKPIRSKQAPTPSVPPPPAARDDEFAPTKPIHNYVQPQTEYFDPLDHLPPATANAKAPLEHPQQKQKETYENLYEAMNKEKSFRYAGIGQRLLSGLIDSLILVIIGMAIIYVESALGFTVGFVSGYNFYKENPNPTQQQIDQFGEQLMEDLTPLSVLLRLTIVLVYVGIYSFYFGYCESSPSQATIGKKALGLKIVTDKGKRLSFANATARGFVRCLMTLPCCCLFVLTSWGFWTVLFTEKRMALHDIICGTYVVQTKS